MKKTTFNNLDAIKNKINKMETLDQLTLKNIKGGLSCPPPLSGSLRP